MTAGMRPRRALVGAGGAGQFWGGRRVPYVTAWSAEEVRQPQIVRRPERLGGGIGYADEMPAVDRQAEALWERCGMAPGRGEPRFARVHPYRQRRAMRQSLCQVCFASVIGRGAEGRTLHLLGSARPVSEGEQTAAPPVHPACAVEAVEACPPLGHGWAAALVEYSPVWGVAGTVVDPRTLKPLPQPGRRREGTAHFVSIDDKAIGWTLAQFLVVSLHGVTAVSLDELHEMARENAEPRAG